MVGASILGIGWPRRTFSRDHLGLTLRLLAFFYALVPGILAAATVAGVRLLGAVWLLALGPAGAR
jgi:hypothetical protein